MYFLSPIFVSEGPQNKDVRIRFIPTIAFQLGLLFPSVHKKLGIAIARDPSLLSLADSSQLDSLLLQPLSDTLDDVANVQQQPVVILVDGCDLLDKRTQTSIINALLELPQHFPIVCAFCCSLNHRLWYQRLSPQV